MATRSQSCLPDQVAQAGVRASPLQSAIWWPSLEIWRTTSHYVDGRRPRPNSTFTNLAMVVVFLNFELDLHLNLDLNLDSNKLDLGLGLELARGQRSGAPNCFIIAVSRVCKRKFLRRVSRQHDYDSHTEPNA